MSNIYWRMTSETYERYLEIYDDLVESAMQANTLAHEFAKEQLRCLPGFPHGINPDLDRVVPVKDDASTHIVTVGNPLTLRSLQ